MNIFKDIFNTVGKINKKLLADAPKIENTVKEIVDKELNTLGAVMVSDATSTTSQATKTALLETALAALASSVASSATGQTITITSTEVAPIATVLINGLDSVEKASGTKLESL